MTLLHNSCGSDPGNRVYKLLYLLHYQHLCEMLGYLFILCLDEPRLIFLLPLSDLDLLRQLVQIVGTLPLCDLKFSRQPLNLISYFHVRTSGKSDAWLNRQCS